jgi:hypothetical protein
MAKFTSHEHGVCSFIEGELFRWMFGVLLLIILPEWLAGLTLVIFLYVMKAFCPHRK